MKNETIDALVQSYDFKKVEKGKLPTIDFVYPEKTADGNTEAFRFYPELRAELAEREGVVREGLKGKDVIRTWDDEVLLEVGKIAPRLGLEEQITGKINSIYAYAPLLFVGYKGEEFACYVVKPVIDHSMAWFELTKEEKKGVEEMLVKKAKEKPYQPGRLEKVIKMLFGKKKEQGIKAVEKQPTLEELAEQKKQEEAKIMAEYPGE